MIPIAYVTCVRVGVTLIVDNRRGQFVDFEWWEYFPKRVVRAVWPHLRANRRRNIFLCLHRVGSLPGCAGNGVPVLCGLVAACPVLWHSPWISKNWEVVLFINTD